MKSGMFSKGPLFKPVLLEVFTCLLCDGHIVTILSSWNPTGRKIPVGSAIVRS